ncbi:hypothetical protein PHLH4_24710 [Pseudomonas sp. St316]|nr:hypothetical protein PHLH4_24710 [Pseudomonas sp. St316]
MQAGPPPSRASSLSHGISGVARPCARRRSPCGSELARGGAITFTTDASRPTAIASRLAPTWDFWCCQVLRPPPITLWERACSRRGYHLHHRCKQAHRHREQARSHMRFLVLPSPAPAADHPVGASLLAKGLSPSPQMQAGPPPSRAGSLPHGIFGVAKSCARRRSPCGSEPARGGAITFTTDASRPTAIASRLAPTWDLWCCQALRPPPITLWERACSRRGHHLHHRCKQAHRHREQARSHMRFLVLPSPAPAADHPVGASLLAMGPSPSISVLELVDRDFQVDHAILFGWRQVAGPHVHLDRRQ